MRKAIFPPVLLAITTKWCTPVISPVVPLGSTPNLVKSVRQCNHLSKNRFDGILLDTGVETVSRVRVAWILRKVELFHLSICILLLQSLFLVILLYFGKYSEEITLPGIFDQTISSLVRGVLSLYPTSVKIRL